MTKESELEARRRLKAAGHDKKAAKALGKKMGKHFDDIVKLERIDREIVETQPLLQFVDPDLNDCEDCQQWLAAVNERMGKQFGIQLRRMLRPAPAEPELQGLEVIVNPDYVSNDALKDD